MIDAIVKEIDTRSEYIGDETIKTIYFGGGTPSVLSSDELRSLVEKVRAMFRVEPNAEITLEINPEDITSDALSGWSESGVNRLSIGIQSFKESDLDWMNRAHTWEQSVQGVQMAQALGFDNISVDLIYGLPDLSMSDWNDHIQRVVDLNIQHVSAYCLTVEEKTALSHWVSSGKLQVPGNQIQSEQFLILVNKLAQNGFEQYEISNFSLNGYRSKHNSSYWRGEKYLGVGPSAHSFNGTSRQWNIPNNQRYMQGVESDDLQFEVEELTNQDRYNELLLTGLRTVEGVDLNALNELRAEPEESRQTRLKFAKNDWLVQDGNHIRLTVEGRLKADYIASELFLTDS